MTTSALAPRTPVIRPINSADAERLRVHHERLSPESRYRRFLAAKPALSSADLRYLVDIDGCDHHALVATLPDVDGDPIVGVARYIRFPEDRAAAEVAIVVGDEFQRRGLGRELVTALAHAAVERGVTCFRATMLTDNIGVQRLFELIAAGPVQRRRLGGLLEMEFGLPGAADAGADCGTAASGAATDAPDRLAG